MSRNSAPAKVFALVKVSSVSFEGFLSVIPAYRGMGVSGQLLTVKPVRMVHL